MAPTLGQENTNIPVVDDPAPQPQVDSGLEVVPPGLEKVASYGHPSHPLPPVLQQPGTIHDERPRRQGVMLALVALLTALLVGGLVGGVVGGTMSQKLSTCNAKQNTAQCQSGTP